MTTRLEVDGYRLVNILFVVLVSAEIIFVLADAIINVERLIDSGPVRRFFNIAREDGVASWFAVIQTWMLGLTATLLYFVARAKEVGSLRQVGWAVLAFFFLYMAFDDGTEFHERVGSWVKAAVLGDDAESRAIGFFPSYTWQLVFLPIFGSFGLFMLWFLNQELTTNQAKVLVVLALGLLVLAVVADFFEGVDKGHSLDLYSALAEVFDTSLGRIRHFAKSFEETLEMLAISLLWVVFLRHLITTAPQLELRFSRQP